MDKVYISIIAILIIILFSLSIYILIKSGIYNGIIKELKAENKALHIQISSAESMIDLQNTKIKNYAVNMQKAEEKYIFEIKQINEKYNLLHKKYKNMNNIECINIIKTIDENQREFLNERAN